MSKLQKKIIESKVKIIYLALDNDALRRYSKNFRKFY